VDKVALRPVFLLVLPLLNIHLYIQVTLFRRTNGRKLGNFHTHTKMLFHKSRSVGYNITSTLSSSVMRSTNSYKVPLVFLVPRSNAELVSKTHVALHSASATFPNINLKSFVKKAVLQKRSKLLTLLPSKSAQMLNFLPLLHTANNPLQLHFNYTSITLQLHFRLHFQTL